MDYTAAREKFERGEVEVTLERVEKSAPDSGRVDQKERNILILIIITNYKSQLGAWRAFMTPWCGELSRRLINHGDCWRG